MNKYAAISLSIVMFLLGIGAGYALTPEYSQAMAEKKAGSMELGAADRYVDLRYVDGMIAHHLNAIYMLKQAHSQSKRPEIISLANTVIAADEQGIEQLYNYKKQWYNDTKQITKYDKVNLGPGDEKFDLRLLNALIAHHDEAIAKAKEIQTKSNRAEVLTLASTVAQSLNENKQTLLEWRNNWYGI